MKKFFFLVLVLSLSIAVTGCGGGVSSSSGSNSSSSSLTYSSDYLGMETGFQLTYNYVDVELGTTTLSTTWVTNVMSATTSNSGTIYKFTEGAPSETTLGTEGEYILKKTSDSNYYIYGDWSGTTDSIASSPGLLMANPITSSLISEKGIYKGQENVTVSAGTFNAYLLENSKTESWNVDNTDYGDCSRDCKAWFVPYLGWVKLVETVTQVSTGKVISTETYELASSAKGVTIKANSSALKSVRLKDSSATKPKWFALISR